MRETETEGTTTGELRDFVGDGKEALRDLVGDGKEATESVSDALRDFVGGGEEATESVRGIGEDC